MAIVDVATSAIQSDLFGLPVESKVKELYGPRVSQFTNDPDRYYVFNPEDATIAPGQRTAEESTLDSLLAMQQK